MAAKSQSFRQLKTETLMCRSLNHSWDVTSTEIVRQTGRYSRTEARILLTCTRCGTERKDRWSREGYVNGRGYAYGEGYLVASRAAWGSTKVFNANVRRELIARLMKG